MKILMIYSREGKISAYAEAMQKGAESAGHIVTVKQPDDRGDMITAHPYDLLIVGSPILGTLGGKIAEDLKPFLSSIKRVDGKESIAFSNRKTFGTDKGMRKLMALLEAQGSIVKDFQTFRSVEEARQFGMAL